MQRGHCPWSASCSIHIAITLAVIAALVWLMQGYSEWKSIRLRQSDASENSMQSELKNEETENKDMHRSNISIAHYILIMPLVTFYVVGRAVVDTARFCLFRLVFACEQAVPLVDDWLFEKVTVQLPNRVKQWEAWWSTHGVHQWARINAIMVNRAVPAMVHCLEECFVILYKAGQCLHRTSSGCFALWQQLKHMQNWTQLAVRLCDNSIALVWAPCSRLALRLYRLCGLVYHGLQQTLVSACEDIHWIAVVLVPQLCSFFASMLPVEAIDRVVTQAAMWVRCVFGQWIASPVLQKLLQSIDRLILFLSTNIVFKYWVRCRQAVLPTLVWALAEGLSLVFDICQTATSLVEHLVLPALSVFVHVVVPRLSNEYRKMVARLAVIYEQYFSLRIQQAIVHILCMLAVPFGYFQRAIYTHITRVLQHAIGLGHIVLKSLVLTLNLCMSHASHVSQRLYPLLQWHFASWPTFRSISLTLSNAITRFEWEKVLEIVYRDVTVLGVWLVEQSNLVLASLERTAGDWVQSQSNSRCDHATQKKKAL